MASTGSDDRIPRYIEATEALRDGRFGVRVPEAGSADQVARLGTALNDLSSALERRWREVAEVDAIAARINAGLAGLLRRDGFKSVSEAVGADVD